MSLTSKYKKKYLYYKSIIEYRKKLKELYPSTQYDSGLDKDYSGHKIIYGEMDYSGIDKILQNLLILDQDVVSYVYILLHSLLF